MPSTDVVDATQTAAAGTNEFSLYIIFHVLRTRTVAKTRDKINIHTGIHIYIRIIVIPV